ncbi:MAG: hypothetical protein P4L62_02405 [Candidatus Pacebacteria bacterium]|nr:hypothetical protein [Candidatus Paceibacterota bacterium]
MKKGKKILGLMIYEPPWQYYVKYKRFLYELKSPFLDSIDFFTDAKLSFAFEKLDKYGVVIFFYHDPLKQLYPEVYEYAKKVKNYCTKKGIIFINNPDALSLSQKSMQLSLLKNKKINVAKTYSFSNWNDFFADKGLKYPIFFRYDIGHDSLGEGCSEPFKSKKELNESKIWKNKKWNKRNHLEGIVAVEWIDTKGKDGFYRKYRMFVFGDLVIKGPLQISGDWFVHGNNALKNKSCRLEDKIFMKYNGLANLDNHIRWM